MYIKCHKNWLLDAVLPQKKQRFPHSLVVKHQAAAGLLEYVDPFHAAYEHLQERCPLPEFSSAEQHVYMCQLAA